MANTNARFVGNAEFCGKSAHVGWGRVLAALLAWGVSAAVAGLLAFGCGGGGPATGDSLAVKAPATASAGTAIQVTVTASDSKGTDACFTDTVHFTSSDSAAVLPADYLFTSNTCGSGGPTADNGTHTFSVALNTAGSQTITATDTFSDGASPGKATVTVSAGAVTQFQLTAPGTATAGSPFTVTVSAADGGGNVASGYTGTAHFTTSDTSTSAVVPSDYTFTAGDAGTHSFTNGFILETSGSQSVTATDTVTSTITGSATISVSSSVAVLQSIAITPISPTIGVGGTQQFTATGTYSDSSTKDLTQTATWKSSNTTVATISNATGSKGLATAGTVVGSTTISATVSSVTGAIPMYTTQASASNYSRYLLDLSTFNISADAVVSSTGQLRAVSMFPLTNSLNYPLGLVSLPGTPVFYLISGVSAVGGLQIDWCFIDPEGQITDVGSDNSANYVGTPVADPLGRFLYVEDVNGDISVYQIGILGSLSTATTAVSGLTQEGPMAIDPTGSYLYVESASGTMTSYQIDGTTGLLTKVNSAAGPTNGTQVLVSPSGNFVYALSSSPAGIYGYSVSNGALTLLPNAPFSVTVGGALEQIAMDPTGSYLYLTEQSTDGVFGFNVGAQGGLTPMQSGLTFAVGQGPGPMNVDATGKYVYVNNRGGDIWVYSIASGSGLLSKISLIRTQGNLSQVLDSESVALQFTPTALFVADEAGGEVSQFNIDAGTGSLSSMSPETLGTGTNPQMVALDPFDGNAYVPAFAGNLTSFGVSSTGLSSTGNVASGAGANWAVIDMSDTYLYVTAQTTSTIWGYTLTNGVPGGGGQSTTTNPGPTSIAEEPTQHSFYVTETSAGAGKIDVFAYGASQTNLTLRGSIAAGSSQAGIAVDPSGQFAYSADPASNQLWEFKVSPSDGNLSLNSTQSIHVGPSASTPGPNSVVVEPSGKYVYAPNQASGQIFGFSIDPATGLLSPLASGAALGTAGTSPMQLAVDISGQYLYCVNQGSSDISVFSINLSTGALTPVGTGTVPAGGTKPNGLAVAGTRK